MDFKELGRKILCDELRVSGKKSNSALSIHWGQSSGSVYQNIPQGKKKLNRDTIF